ncbi:MAG: c-type cytochrome [Rhodothermales bacterium]
MRTLILLPILLAMSAPALYAQEPDLGTEAQREAGRQLYAHKCAHCHGEAGDARSIATPFLRPAPRDFTSAKFKFRTTTSGELPTTEDIKQSIREGMPYTSMPAWKGMLSETEITNLAYFIKTFSDDFSGPYGIPELVEIPKAPAFSQANLQRGREVYLENQCFDCHGDQGHGNGDSTPTLEDDWGQHIRPADMTKRWTFRNGFSREDIYRTFTTGLDGSPMPSYDMPEEDRWALVDYVYSLSRDEPEYATLVVATSVDTTIDLSRRETLFEQAEAAYFPIVGQIIEPGRAFYPGVNGIEVKAVYNQDDIAIMLTWHDMSAETSGRNNPAMEVPRFDPSVPDTTSSDTLFIYSDAVAIQLPSNTPQGVERPYLVFGDARNPVDLWFADLARNNAASFTGRGSGNLEPGTENVDLVASFDDGEWTAIFKRKRMKENGLSFEEGTFVPIAFSVWDGFNQERGNKRGLSSWYHLYLEPMETESAALPMLKYGFLTLVIELILIFAIRRKHKQNAVSA